MHFRRLGDKSYEGKVTFWGNGKMFVTLLSSVLNLPDCNVPRFKFAGLRSSLVGDPRDAGTQASTGSFADNTDPEAGVGIYSQPAESLEHNGRVEATAGYDRVIRTERSTSVAVKVEQEESDMIMSDNDQDSTAIAIKSEASKSSDSDDELADYAATIIDMVQRQKDFLRGCLVAPLQDLPGIWSFHSPDYKQDFGQGIQISFYDRVDHDLAERMCAPGHCKSSTDQIRYCGELRFKAKRGERDWSCLIKQFVVPKQASVAPVKIQSWDPLSKRVIFITAWFLGGGAMSMSLPTTYIPNYQGQKTLLTFSGVKRG